MRLITLGLGLVLVHGLAADCLLDQVARVDLAWVLRGGAISGDPC